jgi:hypothetical protein
MGIGTTKSWADVTEGTQVTVEIADAAYDEAGRFGAEMNLELEIQAPAEYNGETILSSFSLSQPRLRKVRDLREDGLDDETIAEVLRKKGFEFGEIDEPETPKLGGALLKIVKACYHNDSPVIRKMLRDCETFDDLAEALVGKRFVCTTRKDKNDYTRVDGKGEFYRVMPSEFPPASLETASEARPVLGVVEEDFEDIPF